MVIPSEADRSPNGGMGHPSDPTVAPSLGADNEALPVPVIQFDAHDRIVGWNRAAGQLYGLDAEFALGQSLLLFVPHQEMDGFTRACTAARRLGHWVGCLTQLTATGEPRKIEAHWTATADGHILAVHLDRTAQTRNAETRQRAVCWNAIRKMSAATVAESARIAGSPLTPTLTQLKRFCEDPDPTTNIVYRANGQGVLVVGGGRLLNALVASLLEAAGYGVSTATDRHEALRLLLAHPEQFRAAVLGADVVDRDFALELRGHRPLLPLVLLDSESSVDREDEWTVTVPLPADPQLVLAAVAEAVAADHQWEFAENAVPAVEADGEAPTAILTSA
ncbi:MAG: PAS domain-containing protein [Bacteroidales bacterium]|nr:PAS domain-containing protein [Bacteroidales bacterium]